MSQLSWGQSNCRIQGWGVGATDVVYPCNASVTGSGAFSLDILVV